MLTQLLMVTPVLALEFCVALRLLPVPRSIFLAIAVTFPLGHLIDSWLLGVQVLDGHTHARRCCCLDTRATYVWTHNNLNIRLCSPPPHGHSFVSRSRCAR